jgi:hypothetical protein
MIIAVCAHCQGEATTMTNALPTGRKWHDRGNKFAPSINCERGNQEMPQVSFKGKCYERVSLRHFHPGPTGCPQVLITWDLDSPESYESLSFETRLFTMMKVSISCWRQWADPLASWNKASCAPPRRQAPIAWRHDRFSLFFKRSNNILLPFRQIASSVGLSRTSSMRNYLILERNYSSQRDSP